MRVWVRISNSRHVWAEWEPTTYEVAETMVLASLLGTGKADISEILRGIALGAEKLCEHSRKYCEVAELAEKLLEKLAEAWGDTQ